MESLVRQKLQRFSILDQKESQLADGNSIEMLINVDHIVTVKPINMMLEGKIVHGFWVRLANGKKYRALEIPAELQEILRDGSEEVFSFHPNKIAENELVLQ